MGTIAEKKKILLVEDSLALKALYVQALEPLKVNVKTAETLASARRIFSDWHPDLVLLDLNLPDGAGIDLLKETKLDQSSSHFIVITSNGSINSAVDAMSQGAEDFLVKPILPSKLAHTVKLVLEGQKRSKRFQFIGDSEGPYEDVKPRRAVPKASNDINPTINIVGKSASIRNVIKTIEIAGPTSASVLITGKTGTGKELCAEALHDLSPRKSKPFVVLNCAAIPKELMESELFGHVKGSFTGATSTRDGAAHQAHGGTLFLDEIGEMDLALQSKLLRFIQNQAFQRVGSSKTEKVSIRFLAATNRDPLVEIAVGKFREDLFYRLNVVPIHLPDLKDRGDDVLLIADAFIREYSENQNRTIHQFSNAACQKLLSYSWPGNIRQLQNVIRNTLIFAPNFTIEAADIPDKMMPPMTSNQQPMFEHFDRANDDKLEPEMQIAAFGLQSDDKSDDMILKIEPIHLVERKLIDMALEKFDGNVAKVASALDISASSVYRKKSSAD